MTLEKTTCEICEKKAADLTTCKSCGHQYCAKCQSPATKQNYCKDCVGMEGVVSKS